MPTQEEVHIAIDSAIKKNGKGTITAQVLNPLLKNITDFAATGSGTPGQSAYEVAVANGFVGSESEWVASLGGRAGKSAYEIWLEAGNTGTMQDFLNDLKGQPGTGGAVAYTAPTASLSIDKDSNDLEIGETVTVTATAVFTQADAGAQTGIVLRKNGVAFSTVNPAATVVQVSGTPILFKATIAYAQGPNKTEANGDVIPGRIEAGSVDTEELPLRGFNRVWFEPLSSLAESSDAVRAIATYEPAKAGVTYTLYTGTKYTRFAIYFPAYLQLQQVVNIDTGVNITKQFAITNLPVKDAAGTDTSYTGAVLTTAIPFSKSNSLQFILQ